MAKLTQNSGEAERMHIYCVFCQTQRCEVIADGLEKTGVCETVYPKITMRERKEGKNREVLRDLLPGYVFLFSEEGIRDFSVLWRFDGVVRLLGTAETNRELQGSDADFALQLYQRQGIVNAVKAVRIGDRVHLTDPLFANCEGRITKVDNRKQRAKIDFVMSGLNCSTWAALDVIEVTEPEKPS